MNMPPADPAPGGRARDLLARHGATVLILLAVTAAVHGLAAGSAEIPDTAARDTKHVPHVLLPVVAAIGAAFPAFGPHMPGPIVFATCLAALAGLGLFFAAWRLTRNRVVSLSAGVLVAAHPLAVVAARHPDGLTDLLATVVVAWAAAVASRPRVRSPRFPNRAPGAAPLGATAWLVAGLLVTPQVWLAPLMLCLMDLAFRRRDTRPARAAPWWRSLRPYGAVFVIGLGLSFFEPRGASEGFGATLLSTLSPAHASDMPRLIAWLLYAALALGVAALAADQLLDIGRRKTTIPYVGFAAATLLVSVAGVALCGDRGATAGALPGSWGLALAVPVIFWRVAIALYPPATASGPAPGAPASGPPPWAAVRDGLGLTPLPSLADLPALEAPPPAEPEPAAVAAPPPAPRIAFSPALQAALEKLGETHAADVAVATAARARWSRFDRELFDRHLRPRLDAAGHTLAILPPGSPYAGALAAGSRCLTWLAVGDGETSSDRELEGVPGIERLPLPAEGRWPIAGGEIDAAVSLGCLSRLSTSALLRVLAELARVLAPGAGAGLAFSHLDAGDQADGNPLTPVMVTELCSRAGLAVAEVEDELVPGEFLVHVRKGERDGA